MEENSTTLIDSGKLSRLTGSDVPQCNRCDGLWRGNSMSEITRLTMKSKVAGMYGIALGKTPASQ